MANYIETKLRYIKQQDNGTFKKVTESFLVDALTFTEAEARITEEVIHYLNGEFTVSAVKKTNIVELFKSDHVSSVDERYYKVKVMFLTEDEKKTAVNILVQAADLEEALRVFKEQMKGTMADYEVAAIAETPIVDVFDAASEANAASAASVMAEAERML